MEAEEAATAVVEVTVADMEVKVVDMEVKEEDTEVKAEDTAEIKAEATAVKVEAMAVAISSKATPKAEATRAVIRVRAAYPNRACNRHRLISFLGHVVAHSCFPFPLSPFSIIPF